MTYKLAQGWVDPTTLNDIDPQPMTSAIDEGVIKIDGEGNQVFDGHSSVEWEYSVLTPDELNTLLNSMNLIDYDHYKVTISTRLNDDRSFDYFYGTAQRPKFKKDSKISYALWRGVVIKITRIREV